MLCARLLSTWLLVALAISLGGESLSFAVEWFDDFNDGSTTDGNPVTWIEDFGGFFPGNYDASSGDYILTPAPDGLEDSITSSFVDVSFTDVYMRTQGIVLPDPNDPNNVGGNLVLTARFDIATLSGYLVYFDVSGNLNLQLFLGGSGTDIGTTFDTPFNAGSEVVVELNIVGNELSAYAWLADDPNGKPDTPQATAFDGTFLSGVSGIAFAEDDDGTIGVFRYAAAQDTPFVEGVAGDYDNNGVVDAADYVLWRNGGPLANEVHNPGTVSQEDYVEWRARYGDGRSGAGSGGAQSAVPEPSAFLLAMTGFIACLVRRPQQKSKKTGQNCEPCPALCDRSTTA